MSPLYRFFWFVLLVEAYVAVAGEDFSVFNLKPMGAATGLANAVYIKK